MESTAIIRYVDDLGRVAIPKAIRAFLDIRAGTPVEFYVSFEGRIIIKKSKERSDRQ